MLKEKSEWVMMAMGLAVFVMLVLYLFSQDAALVGPV
jgi:hypothetical protein